MTTATSPNEETAPGSEKEPCTVIPDQMLYNIFILAREARRFATERIATQLSTEPVDESETEALLRHAYEVAGLPPPERIQWVDGPLQLIGTLALQPRLDGRWWSVRPSLGRARKHLRASIKSRLNSLNKDAWRTVERAVQRSVQESVESLVGWSVFNGVWASVPDRRQVSARAAMYASMQAYEDASWLAVFRFFDEYLAPNELHALAHFNERVSGYWLGQQEVLLVRRPRLLTRDAEGRLHNETGRYIGYHDGWSCGYAWHGVQVPEQVILSPERLSREDFLYERNLEVRRVIQERMGQRFVPELGGRALDIGPRGTLYEVALPTDPERVACYVQVQDASTARQYFLRVPPTIQTAAEAVAWSFQLAVEAYDPAHET
jgi:hypothetical protein